MNYVQDCSVQMEMLEDGWKKLEGNKEIKTEMMMGWLPCSEPS